MEWRALFGRRCDVRQTHLSRVTLRVTNSVSNGKRLDSYPYLTYIPTYISEIVTRAAATS